MTHVPVTKMHGTYNDFIVVDGRHQELGELSPFARFACDRRTAIGADGVLFIGSSEIADARMRVINADGSEAEMCGNGIRCVARWLAEHGEGDRLRIETLGGIIETEVLARDPEFLVRLALGTPHIEAWSVPYRDAFFATVGNPHVVLFRESLDSIDLPAMAATMQSLVPGGTNVHAATITGPNSVTVRHWERGVGLTLACGTGAVAAASAGIFSGRVQSPVEVRVPGGRLTVQWDGSGPAYLTGPSVRVLDGELLTADAVHA